MAAETCGAAHASSTQFRETCAHRNANACHGAHAMAESNLFQYAFTPCTSRSQDRTRRTRTPSTESLGRLSTAAILENPTQ